MPLLSRSLYRRTAAEGLAKPVKAMPKLVLVTPSLFRRPESLAASRLGAHSLAGGLASKVTISGNERRLTLPASSVAVRVNTRVLGP